MANSIHPALRGHAQSVPLHPGHPTKTSDVASSTKLISALPDHLATGKRVESRTYGLPKARGKGTEEENWDRAKKMIRGGIITFVVVSAVFMSLVLLVDYLIAKRAVHRGIIEAARDGAIGNAQNRLNAASA